MKYSMYFLILFCNFTMDIESGYPESTLSVSSKLAGESDPWFGTGVGIG